jgi:hypothetical protein
MSTRRTVEIDDALELRWLLDRIIRRLLAFQDFVDEIGRAPIRGAIPAHPVGVTQKQQVGLENQIHGNPRTSAPLPQRRAARGAKP